MSAYLHYPSSKHSNAIFNLGCSLRRCHTTAPISLGTLLSSGLTSTSSDSVTSYFHRAATLPSQSAHWLNFRGTCSNVTVPPIFFQRLTQSWAASIFTTSSRFAGLLIRFINFITKSLSPLIVNAYPCSSNLSNNSKPDTKAWASASLFVVLHSHTIVLRPINSYLYHHTAHILHILALCCSPHQSIIYTLRYFFPTTHW